MYVCVCMCALTSNCVLWQAYTKIKLRRNTFPVLPWGALQEPIDFIKTSKGQEIKHHSTPVMYVCMAASIRNSCGYRKLVGGRVVPLRSQDAVHGRHHDGSELGAGLWVRQLAAVLLRALLYLYDHTQADQVTHTTYIHTYIHTCADKVLHVRTLQHICCKIQS